MFYDGFHVWGMHLVWWLVWGILLFWIFATSNNISGQSTKKDTPLDILKKCFSSGQIKKEVYQESKKMSEIDLAN